MDQRHPHTFTLSLLKLAVDKMPPTFSAAKTEEYRQKLKIFESDPGVDYANIQQTIVGLGKVSWPYRKAYEEMYSRYGRSSEESFLLKNLDAGIRDKYERFVHDGGKINHFERARSVEDLRRPSPFERYFSPEEKFAIEQALLAARDAARKEIDSLVTDKKKEEYDSLVESYKERQANMEKKLGELRSLVGVSKKWAPAITDRIKTLEEGWSVVEPGVNEEDLDHELDHWRGTLEAFLNE